MKVDGMRFFLAGIMQGSRQDTQLHPQNYRQTLQRLIAEHFPQSVIYDPLADHAGSVDYDDETARRVFYGHNRMCRDVDVVLAYIPEASMGTAIEIWEAHEHGRAAVVTISPLKHNWAIRFCSHAIFDDLEAFAAALASGSLQRRIAQVLAE